MPIKNKKGSVLAAIQSASEMPDSHTMQGESSYVSYLQRGVVVPIIMTKLQSYVHISHISYKLFYRGHYIADKLYGQ